MATKNIVPRATGEGGIGTSAKHWGNGYFDSLAVAGTLLVGGHDVGDLLSSAVRQIVGVKWDTAAESPTLTRVDAVGAELAPSATYFDLHPTWGGMRRCTMDDAGAIVAYQGDPAFAADGSNGQVMVEIPRFYYRTATIGTDRYFWISPAAASGFTVHPMFVRDGVESAFAYVGAFEASVYDVTAGAAELDTITVTAGASASGNLTITLDGNYSFTVAVAAEDDAAAVAGKIRAAGNKTDYPGVVWTVGGADADVTYTAGGPGLKTTVTVGAASTGVTTTIVKSTPGAGGYTLNDAGAGYDLTATTGDTLASVAGVKPATGWKNASLTLPKFRQLAQNRGAGWGLPSYHQMAGLQLLFIVEYATLDSQTALSAGVTNITDDATTNMAVNTGFTAGVGTGSSALGNASGHATVTHYQTAQATAPFSYRGIENLWGNTTQWVDGINLKADRNPWIADHDFASDTFAHPYVDTGLVLAATGYPTALANVPSFDYAFLPTAIGGAVTKYTCDIIATATGTRALMAGGSWDAGSDAGIFEMLANNASTYVTRRIGARLARSG